MVSTTCGSRTSHCSAGATTALKSTVSYDAAGHVSVGTLTLGKVDLAGAVTWNALSLTYNTPTKLWTGSPVIVGAASGSMSLNIVDATGAVTAGSLTTGPVSLFSALPLGSLTLTSAGTSWHLTSTPAGVGSGSVSASFPVTTVRDERARPKVQSCPVDRPGTRSHPDSVATRRRSAGPGTASRLSCSATRCESSRWPAERQS